MRKALILLACFAVIMSVVFFAAKNIIVTSDFPEYPIPETGKWICDELGIVISFDKHDPYSTIMINGRKVICLVGNERYTPDIYLICQDRDALDYYMGEMLFLGTIVEFGTDHFMLAENKTDETYMFIKQE